MMTLTAWQRRFRCGAVWIWVVMLVTMVVPSWGAKANVESFLDWSTSGTANPDLIYHFRTFNRGQFTSVTTPELLLPVSFFGRILRDSSVSLGTCGDGGFVEDFVFQCWEPSQSTMADAPCPFAEGIWSGQAQMTTLTQAWFGMSNLVIANCPPVCTDVPDFPSLVTGSGAVAKAESPVSSKFDASLVTGIDLDTGYQLDRSVAGAIPRGDLHRVEKIDGTTYVLDEYAVVDVSGGEGRVERASSVRTAQDAAAWGRAISEQKARSPRQGLAPKESGRYLIIQGMEHITGERRPMVKFRPPSEAGLGPGGQVVVRTRFSADGEIEEVETLQGDPLVARALVPGIELVFIEGSEHRVVVYAVFQGGDRPQLTAAIPTFIQCCCDGFLCPG